MEFDDDDVNVDGQAIQADVSYFGKTMTMAAARPFYTVLDITTRLQLTNHKRVKGCIVGLHYIPFIVEIKCKG